MKKLFIVLMAAILLSPTAASAVNQNESQGSSQAGGAGQRVENAIKNCDRVEARIQKRVENFGQSKDKHMTVYSNMLNRLNKFVERAESAGLDTSQIVKDIATLQVMIADFESGIDDSYSQLQRTQTYSCGESEGNFKQALVQSRNQLKLSHQKAADIRDFYQETIRTDLLDLKTQLEAAEVSSEETDTNITE